VSRSHKKTPVRGICTGDSQKGWKQESNRRERRVVKHIIKKEGEDLDVCDIPLKREVSDEWDGPYDGKVYDRGLDDDDKFWRK
jgi:hypothetical protein